MVQSKAKLAEAKDSLLDGTEIVLLRNKLRLTNASANIYRRGICSCPLMNAFVKSGEVAKLTLSEVRRTTT